MWSLDEVRKDTYCYPMPRQRFLGAGDCRSRARLPRLVQTCLLLLTAAVLSPLHQASSQGSSSAAGLLNISLEDAVYRDLDHLAMLGVLDSLLLGTRPYSRREVTRLVAAARRTTARQGYEASAYVRSTLDALFRRFPADTATAPPGPVRWRLHADRLDAFFTSTDRKSTRLNSSHRL